MRLSARLTKATLAFAGSQGRLDQENQQYHRRSLSGIRPRRDLRPGASLDAPNMTRLQHGHAASSFSGVLEIEAR
jgi:hypothetical protein